MKKIGMIIGVLGVLIYLTTIDPIKKALPTFPAPITDTYVIIGSMILVIVGAVLAFRGSSKQSKEVPIYQGKNVVGYRRLGK